MSASTATTRVFESINPATEEVIGSPKPTWRSDSGVRRVVPSAQPRCDARPDSCARARIATRA